MRERWGLGSGAAGASKSPGIPSWGCYELRNLTSSPTSRLCGSLHMLLPGSAASMGASSSGKKTEANQKTKEPREAGPWVVGEQGPRSRVPALARPLLCDFG